ncbi:unnamed protein product [Rangifer tarandus platyrhynchus]|uniref:Uncharacterized protein n=1 Tax=Rangifer tarandus platyrhynchus TaxID=3082113 RepID=A0ABN8XYC6_RANTA|nr:unnamed protein product [Rangifer tarandus platyrhynchus]
MLISGLGVGDAWARGLPEEVTSGRDLELQEQSRTRIPDPGSSSAAPAYTSPEEMDHLPRNTARARDRGHDDPLNDARETHQQARRILTQQNSTCEKLDTEQYRQNEL